MKTIAWLTGLLLAIGTGAAMAQAGSGPVRLQGGTADRPSLLKALPPRRDDVSPLARLLSEARQNIEKRHYAEVYEALSARLDLYAGDVEFDYLYGIAAMESEAPGKAVLALERVLINKPDHLLARAELARAYLMVREQENARREFEAVAAQKIPPQAREVINRYLDALTRAKDQPGLSTRYEVVLEAGHDTNVNVASQSDRWLLADGTQVYPLPPSQPRSSLYLGAGGGVDLAIPINGLVQWTTGLKGMLRKYPSAHTLDQEQVDFSTGFAYRKQCHQFKMLGQLQILTLGGNPFRRATGLVGQWQCDLNSRQQIGAFAQRFDLDFADQGQRNATRQALGISYARVLPRLDDSVLLATLQSGARTPRRASPTSVSTSRVSACC
ncbi:MAG: hypothetical protein R3E68_18170 [Burkholderiaceae bacterium]